MVLLVSCYLVVGCLIGAELSRRGAPFEVAAAALLGWPLQVHLLESGLPPALPALPGVVAPPGPHQDRIDHAFASVRELLQRTGHGELDLGAELEGLRSTLRLVDERLGVVDGILADVGSEAPGRDRLDASLAELADVRARAEEEVEAVVTELLRLRVQIGIVSLSGDTLPVRDGLRALTARVTTLGELARMTGG